MERYTKKTIGCFEYDIKQYESGKEWIQFRIIPGAFADYDTFFAYQMAIRRLGKYEDAIPFERIAEAAELLREKDATEREAKLNPCKGCDVGYGSYSMQGYTSCHDTCEKLKMAHNLLEKEV